MVNVQRAGGWRQNHNVALEVGKSHRATRPLLTADTTAVRELRCFPSNVKFQLVAGKHIEVEAVTVAASNDKEDVLR